MTDKTPETPESSLEDVEDFHASEESEEATAIDMTLPASRAEVVSLMQTMAEDVQGVVGQFNEAINQILANQAMLDDRLKALEDPAKPRIFIP